MTEGCRQGTARFSPLLMKHVTIQALTSDLPAASLILAELESFNPDLRPETEGCLPETPGHRYRELHKQAQERLLKISSYVSLTTTTIEGGLHSISESVLEETNRGLGEAWQLCSEYEEGCRTLQDELRTLEQLEDALSNFRQLKVDLGLLQEEKRFLDIRIGVIPHEHVNQLRDAVGLDGYLLFVYMQISPNSHVVIIGQGEDGSPHLGSVLDTAGFRPLQIPPELHSKPEEAEQILQARRKAADQQQQALNLQFSKWRSEATAQLERSAKTLLLAAPYVALGEAAHSQGSLTQVHGWTPAADIQQLEEALRGKLDNPFVLECRDPTPEERPLVPSVLRHNRLLKPFSILVTQYGVPRYGELNPTLIFAITFVCMFGMMFGDVGHGAVILLAGFFARRKLGPFTFFAVSAGVSSILFGFLYGSLFGYEHILRAVWISPLSDPLYMLTVGLIWGIGFITLNTLLNIINHLTQGDHFGALFDHHGILSLLFYAGLLGIGYGFISKTDSSLFWSLLAWLSLGGLFSYQIIKLQTPPAERVLVAFIETFETVIGYISNTLSFLRVAAFSLNHVALAIAVFTLANNMGEAGHWAMILFGNLFILVLEGAIVTIQALRLEYYEGFTRFYAGDGRVFKPLQL